MNDQEIFQGLHYNRNFYDLDDNSKILASNIVETSNKQLLNNTSQSIDGIKTFTSEPIFSTGISASSINDTASKAFLNNTSQTITGVKTFSNGIDVSSIKQNNVEKISISSGNIICNGSKMHIANNNNKFIEFGTDTANVAYIDFHSSDTGITPDYHARIISNGGTTTYGTGTLTLEASSINFTTPSLKLNGLNIGSNGVVEYVTAGVYTWKGEQIMVINTNAPSSGCTVTLPPASLSGRTVTIFNNGGNNVVVNTTSPNKINGDKTTLSLTNNYENCTLLEVVNANYTGYLQISFNSNIRFTNNV